MHRGPKPKPNAQTIAPHEPIDPTCPAELVDPMARAEWDRIVPALTRGHVSTVDRATLIGYCLKYAQWRALETLVRKNPFVVKASRSGYPMPNPAVGMANKVFTLMLRAAAELGITPSSRSRVVAVVQSPDDAFTATQKARPLVRVK